MVLVFFSTPKILKSPVKYSMWQEVNQYSEVQLCQIWTSVKVLNISEAVLFFELALLLLQTAQ